MAPKPALIIIAGPTGAGKTDVAIELAEQFGAEIISADSMQVYRYMDIGTAKPSKEQRARVGHHLIDVADPDEDFSAARFRRMAGTAISRLHQEGRPIFVAGGTGLYIKALTRGLFGGKEHDPAVREQLRKEAKSLGLELLYERLQGVDPETAQRIGPNDRYRIIRALEVHLVTGKAISDHHKAHGFHRVRYRTLKIGLGADRETLYSRIDGRVELMLKSGLVDEVKWLLAHGYHSGLKSMRSIGYRHVADYLEGRLSWEETVRLFKRDTRRYAKRQLTWFRADPEIIWMDPEENGRMRVEIDSFLSAGK